MVCYVIFIEYAPQIYDFFTIFAENFELKSIDYEKRQTYFSAYRE